MSYHRCMGGNGGSGSGASLEKNISKKSGAVSTLSATLQPGKYAITVTLTANTQGNLSAWHSNATYTNLGTLVSDINTGESCAASKIRAYILDISEETVVSTTSYAQITMTIFKIN